MVLPKRGAPSIQRTSSLKPYQAYLKQRWEEGVSTATQLWRKLQARGYTGSQSSVYRALKPLGPRALPKGAAPRPGGTTRRALSPRQAMWALLRDEEELTEREVQARSTLRAAAPMIAEAAELGERFLRLIRQRDASALDPWLEDAGVSGVVELRRFATGLRQAYAAVRTALELIDIHS
jgi:transposase